jgi:adenylate kinase family enzyme
VVASRGFIIAKIVVWYTYPMRIDIVGLPASGKSTLATAISKKLSIPHIHLDRFWFESGGRQGRHDTPNIEEVKAKVKVRALEAIKAGSWVSDGVYLNAQEEIAARADVIVFLDIPLPVQLLNHAHRAFFEPKRHTELGLWDEITFFREIIRRNSKSRPKLLQFIKEHKDKVVTLRSRKEINTYVDSI